jgi:DNA-binding response OmpR family regulator
MILVVDDDKVLTQLLQSLLESNGFEVEVAHDGEDAYNVLKKRPCETMLLDINMPGINGAELLMLMAAEDIHVPTIVVATFPDFDEEEFKQFPNVEKLFHKPFYPEDILAAVKETASR